MPRVTHVKKARKDNDKFGIKRGDSYYWWQFAFSTKQCSKTPPKPSQLTRSTFLIAVYSLQESLSDFEISEESLEDLAQQIREIGDQCQESFDNMPDGLQMGDTGILLEERVEAMEEWASEVENICLSHEPTEEEKETAIEELQSMEPNL